MAIPVKKGENFEEEERAALKGEHHFEGELLLSILLHVIYGCWVLYFG